MPEAMTSSNDDHENLMNHVALEAMHAIEAKDKEGFVSALHVLMADLLHKMGESEGDDDVDG